MPRPATFNRVKGRNRFSLTLQRLMKQRGLSSIDLAAQAFGTINARSKINFILASKHANPQWDTVLALCKALNVEPNVFV